MPVHTRLLAATILAASVLGACLFIGGAALGAEPSKEARVRDSSSATDPTPAKPRLLVLTDIGGDPDDQQLMIRLMTYANEFEIEGLIASATGTPGEVKEETTAEGEEPLPGWS